MQIIGIDAPPLKTRHSECAKHFCACCLKNHYDMDFEKTLKPGWACPFCKGKCFCSRCRRQEQINTCKGLMIGLELKYAVK